MDIARIPSKTKVSVEKEKGLLTLELAEIKEISELLFKKLEKKIQVIEALEASVDAKISTLEGLIQRAESLQSGGGGSGRQHDIVALRKKGLGSEEIAEALGMPRGEVELTLNLHTLGE